MRLVEAERAVTSGHGEAALDALLAAWRSHRAPEIAALVDALTAELPPIEGTKSEYDRIWHATESQRRPVDYGRLLSTLLNRQTDASRRLGEQAGGALARARLARLAKWPADPRTAPLAARLFGSNPDGAFDTARNPYWKALAALVIAHSDPRAHQLLSEARRKQRLGYPWREAFERLIDPAIAAAEAIRAPELGGAERAACTRIAKQLAKRRPNFETLGAGDARARMVATAPTPVRVDAAVATGSARGSLQAARAAWRCDERETALRELIAAWRRSRSPYIAGVIDQVSNQIAAALPDLPTTGNRRASQAAWLAVAAERREHDLPRLLAALTGAIETVPSTDARLRLEAIADWPDDPRTTAAVERQLRDLPYYAATTKPFWAALFDQLVRHGDPRAIAMLEGLAGQFATFVPSWSDADVMVAWFERTARATADRLRARWPQLPAELDRTDVALCDEIGGAVSAAEDRIASLLAAIYANPDDPDVRQVYSDALLERGDPHGEFIALQLANRDPDRQAALLAAHQDAFSGPFAMTAFVEASGFRGGFPDAVRLNSLDGMVGNPAWATVRRLELNLYNAPLPEELLRHPVMARLDHLGVLDEEWLRSLLRWPTIHMTSLALSLYGDLGRPSITRVLVESRSALARLRALEVRGASRLDWIWQSWLTRQLTRLQVSEHVHELALGTWFRRLSMPALALQELELSSGDRGAVFVRRDQRGAFTSLEARLGTSRQRRDSGMLLTVDRLVASLATLPNGGLTRLTVIGPQPRRTQRARLDAQLERFPGSEFAWHES